MQDQTTDREPTREVTLSKMNIVRQGNKYSFFNEIEILNKLESDIYEVDWGMFGLFIKKVAPLDLPEKVYDIEKPFRDRILKSFNSLNRNIGVLLQGYKGMGKSVTTKQLCIESKLPVIMITRSIPSNIDFVSFLNSIQQDYVLFIDEFEKIFKAGASDRLGQRDEAANGFHDQDVFLSFMDGVSSGGSKKLFLLTSNTAIGDKFINRPSRIRYYKNYEFISEEMYNLIIADKLDYPEYRQDLLESLPITECSVDLVHTVIEEINIQGVPYSDFKDTFNHKSARISYTREIYKDGTFSYYDTIEEAREISRNASVIGGVYNCKIIQVTDAGIVYKVKEAIYKPKSKDDGDFSEDEDDQVREVVDVVYRIKKARVVETIAY